MNDEEIRIGDLLITIVKRWKTVLVLTLLGFGFGFVLNSVSFVKGTYTSYEITCSIAITAQGTNGNFANGGGQLTSGDFQLAEDMADAVSYVLWSDRVLEQAIEDARFVLPNACDTKMIVTMNARSLHNFFKHRCCARAQWEIRALADEMLRLVYPIAPALFAMAGPSCVRGACSEGSMTCGEAVATREKYAKLKEEALGR